MTGDIYLPSHLSTADLMKKMKGNVKDVCKEPNGPYTPASLRESIGNTIETELTQVPISIKASVDKTPPNV